MPGKMILVIAETRGAGPEPVTLEILGIARAIADERAASVGALLFHRDEAVARALIQHGADEVFQCASGNESLAEAWLPVVERIARERDCIAVLAAHTPMGAELAPRLAFRLETAAATACVEVKINGDKLAFTRTCYGGNLRETLTLDRSPAVATIKAGSGKAIADAGRLGRVIPVAAPAGATRVRFISRQGEADAARLEDAKVIVAGGRGLGGPEGFELLQALAQALGGAVGASRVPCDLGWCPHSWQIGLTGKTVTPDLYIAVGISGAGHHMAGCGNAGTIVAINQDPDAFIFREARFGIVGDYREIVPALIAALGEAPGRARGEREAG